MSRLLSGSPGIRTRSAGLPPKEHAFTARQLQISFDLASLLTVASEAFCLQQTVNLEGEESLSSLLGFLVRGGSEAKRDEWKKKPFHSSYTLSPR